MNMKEKIKKFIDNINEHHISEHTAQTSYYIILSFVPFVILLMTLIKYINIDENTLINILEQIIPNTFNNQIIDIVQEIYSKSLGTISISLIFTLWSAGKGFYSLSQGFDEIYEEDRNKKNYILDKVKSIGYTIVFLLIIILILVVMPFGNQIQNIIDTRFEAISAVTSVIFRSREIILFIGMFIMFLMMYKFIPKIKWDLRYQIPGAVIASIGWIIVSDIFSAYLNIFSGFSAMYGSLTTIILLLMWVYFCIYIFLLGVEVNKAILIKYEGEDYIKEKQNRKVKKQNKKQETENKKIK